MQSFISKQGRSGANSPSNEMESRKARAANAKVALPRPGFTQNHPHQNQHNIAARRQGLTNTNQPEPQERRPADVKPDPYGTDAESIDTTTHLSSVVQVADGQQHASALQDDPGYIAGEHSDEYDSVSVEEDVDFVNEQHQEVHFQQGHAKDTFLGEGNSYPSTTSGVPEDFPDNRTVAKERPVDRQPPSNQVSHPQQPTKKYSGAQAPAQQIFPPQAHQNKPVEAPRSNILAKSATYRQQDRASVNSAARKTVDYQAPLDRASVQPTFLNPHQKTHVQRGLPQCGSLIQSNPQHVVPSVEQAGHTVRIALGQAKQEPNDRFQTQQETSIEAPTRTNEDYEGSELFGMSYDDLRDESFDYVPGEKSQVLTPEMLNQPLENQLAHAWKRLPPQHQFAFFQSLTKDQWEDAGDWFLTQFSDIIKRTKETRQKKRKLASEFEDEVEKRYRHVEKRQHHVDDALKQMGRQGQNLIPKSPRASKEPRRAR